MGNAFPLAAIKEGLETAAEKQRGENFRMPENKCQESCADLTRLEQQLRDLVEQNGKDHKELRERLGKVELTNAVQNAKYDAILDNLTKKHDTLNRKLEALESKPGKRWDGLVEKAVWLVLAALIGAALAKLGL